MDVKHHKADKKGAFYFEPEGEKLAEMTYVFAGPGKMIIDHTEVNDSQRGKGIGYKLVAALVEYARANQLKILPLCPFAKAVFDKTKEYNDVLF